jgi:hypothetical protein
MDMQLIVGKPGHTQKFGAQINAQYSLVIETAAHGIKWRKARTLSTRARFSF